MALRELLSASQREAFEAVPLDRAGLIEYYVLSDQDFSLIRRRRGAQNRLGLAVQLALLRYPGRALLPDETPPAELVTFLARQLGLSAGAWTSYAERDETRREHLAELQLHYGLRSFGIGQYRSLSAWLMPTALQTNRGAVLVRAGIDELRRRSVVVPRIAVLERLCAEVIVRSERLLFETLTADLSDGQRRELDALLNSETVVKSAPLHGCVRRQAHQPVKTSCFISSVYSIFAISNCALTLASSSIRIGSCSSPARARPRPRSTSPASTSHAVL